MNLTERLKLFPGGLQALAVAAGLATTVVYRFAWKEHKKRPVAVALRIAQALCERGDLHRSLQVLEDVEVLLDAWSAAEPSRVRDDSRVTDGGGEAPSAGGAS